MAVVYEETEDGLVKAYSDRHKKIYGGSPEGNYDVVYDPKDANRTYTETDQWIDTYTPPKARVFSKLSLELALFNLGILSQVDAFIDSQTITNSLGQTMPLRRAYDTALTFAEDNEYFSQFKTALQQELSLTDEQIEAILSSCITKQDI